MALGVVLSAPDGSSWHCGQSLPGTGCNNEAELRALQAGLALAQAQGAASVRIYTDSQWLVQQLAVPLPGAPRVRTTQRLQPRLENARQALHNFEQLQWRWIPRHCNTQADALARHFVAAPIGASRPVD